LVWCYCVKQVSELVWQEIGPAPNSPCEFASALCGSYFAGLIFG
jgi:hypothetical protein